MKRVTLIVTAAVVTAVLAGWFLVVRVPEWFGPRPVQAPAPAAASETPVRKIRARLFYVSREQLQPAPAPLLGALPPGTGLRTVFLTERGDAYVDLTAEASTAHTGGSLDELFSVYAIVNLLTSNLPAISRVQILVDGKEVDSLAGHIDLRHPLPRNDRWSEPPAAGPAHASEPAAESAGGPGEPPAATTQR